MEDPLITQKPKTPLGLKLVLVLLFMITTSALVVGSVALYKISIPNTKTMTLANPPFIPWSSSGAPPYVDSYLGSMEDVSCTATSTDTAGAVQVVRIYSGEFNVHVHFGQDFTVAPRSITLTSGSMYINGTLWVVNIRTNGFNVHGYFTVPSYDAGVTLFYYHVDP